MESTFPGLFRKNGNARPNSNFNKVVPFLHLVYDSFCLDLQVRILKLRVFHDCPKRGRKATGDGTKQQIFRCPSALQAAKCGRRSEMDRIGRRTGFCKASPPRGPPGNYSKPMYFFHGVITFLRVPHSKITEASRPQLESWNVTVIVVSTSTGSPLSRNGR